MVIGTYILIFTLNMNGLNAPTKRHRLAEWIEKQDLYICCLLETHLRPRDTFIRDKEGHYITIKGSIQEEDITILNIYASNIGVPQYIRQILTVIKGEIDSNTIIVGNFYTPLSSMDRSFRQKVSKETQALNNTLDQMDLIDIYRTLHPKAEK